MVAAVIVLLVLLSLIGTVAFGLRGTREAEGSQDAVLHARRLIELIRERRLPQVEVFPPEVGFSDPAVSRTALDAFPFQPKPSGEDFPAGTGYTRRIVTERLSEDGDDYRSRLYLIDVTVFWKIKGRENQYQLTGYYRAP